MATQNLQDAAKAVIGGKFIAIEVFLIKAKDLKQPNQIGRAHV